MAGIKASSTIRNSYRAYKKKYKNSKHGIVSNATYVNIIGDFNTAVMDNIIYNKSTFHIPAGLGTLCITKYKQRTKVRRDGTINHKINYAETVKLWKANPELRKKKYIYADTESTGGYVYYFRWDKVKGRVHKIKSYKLKVAWDIRMRLFKHIQQNPHVDYV